MRIELARGTIKQSKSPIVVLPVLQSAEPKKGKKSKDPLAAQIEILDRDLRVLAAQKAARQKFSPGDLNTLTVERVVKKQIQSFVLVGFAPTSTSKLGAHDLRFSALQRFRRLGLMLFELAKRLQQDTIACDVSALQLEIAEYREAFLEGLFLAGYSFKQYKSGTSREFALKTVQLHGAPRIEKAEISRIQAMCEATCLARDLVNTPAVDCTTTWLANAARDVAKKGRLSAKVLAKPQLKELGCGGILAVGQGSDHPPYLVKLTYKPRKRATKVVALVGKGVTFDSGGYNMKPTGSIETMKCDMSGAAAVIGAMQAIAKIRPGVEVRAYLPIVENMVSGSAIRPGDIYKSLSGKTVEILNTDAEGRLILADAITLAEREKPDMIIDLATLTGACVVALGEEYAGLFSNNEELASAIQDASAKSGERFWRLPLVPEYREMIKGNLADIRNHAGRWGGAITAALFLEEFVTKTAWAHLDIAGPAFAEGARGINPKGGVGFAVRTLCRLVEGLA